MQNEILIIHRDVKYPRIEIKTGKPVLIIPSNGKYDSVELISRHKNWLDKKMAFVKSIQKKYKKLKIYSRSEEELSALTSKIVEKFSKKLKKKPQKIIFRNMKTKWGSCGTNGRVTLNRMLKFLPPSLVRYVAFHELLHLTIRNHNKKFWLAMSQEFKNYPKYEEKLFGYWFLVNKANEALENNHAPNLIKPQPKPRYAQVIIAEELG